MNSISCLRNVPLLEEIRLWSARTRLAVALPSALRESGQIYNSGFWFQDGNVSRFHKHGLTESERQFFAQPESSGSRTFTVRKFNLGILLCREAEDAAWTHFEEESVDAVLWPAYWGWTQADDWGPTQLNGSPNLIHANMALWKAPLIQSCFASNVPADSAKRAPQGLSIVVDADNRCVGRAPWARSSLTTITLSRADESTRVLRVEELAPRS